MADPHVIRHIGPFVLLGAVQLLVAIVAWRATHREGAESVGFHLCIQYGVTALGFLFLAVVGIADSWSGTNWLASVEYPGFTRMATGTILALVVIGAGKLCFVWLRLRRGR